MRAALICFHFRITAKNIRSYVPDQRESIGNTYSALHEGCHILSSWFSNYALKHLKTQVCIHSVRIVTGESYCVETAWLWAHKLITRKQGSRWSVGQELGVCQKTSALEASFLWLNVHIALTVATVVYGLLRYYKTNPKVNNVRLYSCGHVHNSTTLTYNVSIFHKVNCTRSFRAVY